MGESTEPRRTAALAETAVDRVDRAYRELLEHAISCAGCVANWRACPTRQELAEQLREARG